jgi:aspartate racemase
MKTIGIIGGIGPESTVDYYRGIITRYRETTGDEHYPRILINSINMTAMLGLVSGRSYDALASMLLDSIEALARAGADLAAIASNTPHIVYDEVSARSPLPLISIVEAAAEKAASLGMQKALLIGTAFTMASTFYRDCFARHGIPVIVPPGPEQAAIHGIIFPELEEGIVVPEKKARLLGICNRIIETERVDGVILGCTELPLMVKDGDLEVCVLNTTRIHVDAIVSRLAGNQ